MEIFQCAYKTVMVVMGRWLGGGVGTKYRCWDWLHLSEFLNHQPKEMGFFSLPS